MAEWFVAKRSELQDGDRRMQRRQQFLVHRDGRRDVHRRRNHVVRRLRHVDVVVRMDELAADLAAKPLQGQVGDDLVRIHVRRGAAAGLEDVDGKLVVQLAVDDALRGLDDGLGLVLVQQVQVTVGLGRCLLDEAERLDEPARKAQVADGKVVDGTLGLRAVERIRRDAHFAQRILFNAIVSPG